MPQQCKLLLDNYTGQYVAGLPIQGRVFLSFDSDVKLRGLRITLSCHEHTEWIGTESYYDSDAKEHRSRDTQFTGDQEVFAVKQWLYGDQHGNTNLSMGQHIYAFTINLPQNIPGTYQCDKGSVTYKLVATVDRPMAMDYEDQMVIVVNSPVELNFIARPEDLQPSTYSDEKSVCCWCCAQGPITMDLELSKRILMPGERVDIKISLTNQANINVEGVSLELKQIITYKVTDPNRDDKQDVNILADLKDVGLGAHGEHTYLFNVCLPPHIVLPNFAQCGLFSVEYVYKAVAKLPSMHNNLEIIVRPKVGHIPLGASQSKETNAQGMLYPSMGWTGGSDQYNPSAPPPPLDSKILQAGDIHGYNDRQGPFEQPPPSYDSLKMP